MEDSLMRVCLVGSLEELSVWHGQEGPVAAAWACRGGPPKAPKVWKVLKDN